jgi:hypothetical protein
MNKPKLEFDDKAAFEASADNDNDRVNKPSAYGFKKGAQWQHSQTAKLVDEMWEIIVMQNEALKYYSAEYRYSHYWDKTEDTTVIEHDCGHEANKTLAAVEAKIKMMEEKL